MSRRDWERFGSSYDPNYRGGKRPQPNREKERQEMRDSNYQIRGCGNPNCEECNSHIPREVARSMPRGRPEVPVRFLDISNALGSNADFMRNYQAMMDDMMGVPLTPPPRPEAGPPPSYVAARKAVEEWLVVAPEQEFDDIVGNEVALEQLRDAIQAPVKHKELYEAYGMKMPKGALLSGPPGCGKTMFARAAASEMRRLYGDKVEFISISGSVGVTSMDVVSAVRDIYEENKGLDHSYALDEFRTEFMKEVQAKYGEKNGQG